MLALMSTQVQYPNSFYYNSSGGNGKSKSSKKPKPEPSREEIHKTTLSDILQQLGIHFDQDLMHRKAKVKDIITNVINNMSDEDEEGNESDENADIGGGANKYCDGDDDA
ncbi:hypothetical protein GOBAR_DD02484 [Gossypium barbadense]|nr:hypothetical protein GOBAR_DD02484 [Gossypium barbadense]